MKNVFAKTMRYKLSFLILFLFVFTSAYSHGLMNFGPKENETAAIGSIQTIRRLQINYAEKHGGKYAANFDELIQEENLDARFSGETPIVDGYVFVMKTEEPRDEKPGFYSVNADPEIGEGPEKTGNRHFYIDSTLKTLTYTTENRPAKLDDIRLKN